MDTNTALDTLLGIRNTIIGNLNGMQAQIDAIDVAMNLLQGTLQTQLTEVETLKVEKADLLAQMEVLTKPVEPPVEKEIITP